MTPITLGGKKIGTGNPVFIIAEAGVNHNGNMHLAYKLIDAAKRAGADAVKFQAYSTDALVTKTAKTAAHHLGAKTQHDLLKSLELTLEDFHKLKAYCERKKILFLTAAHSPDVLKTINRLVCAHKIGSGDLTNLPFLEKVAKLKKPIILSTGMATLKEVSEAVDTLYKWNRKIILLHCTSHYPCPLDDANIRAITTLQKTFPFALVGYSDHTSGLLVSPLAVALRACVLETHFTLDTHLPGPDHAASLNPQEMKAYVEVVRAAETALGSGKKKPTPHEMQLKKLVRKSIIAAVDIKKGTQIASNMLAIKRPEGGLRPAELKSVIGTTAKRNIPADSVLKKSDFKKTTSQKKGT